MGKATTVPQKAARHNIPKACGDEDPPTFLVIYAPNKAPREGPVVITIEYHKYIFSGATSSTV